MSRPCTRSWTIGCPTWASWIRSVIDQMDAELRGNPVFASVEEMGEVELEARRRADDLIDKQL